VSDTDDDVWAYVRRQGEADPDRDVIATARKAHADTESKGCEGDVLGGRACVDPRGNVAPVRSGLALRRGEVGAENDQRRRVGDQARRDLA